MRCVGTLAIAASARCNNEEDKEARSSRHPPPSGLVRSRPGTVPSSSLLRAGQALRPEMQSCTPRGSPAVLTSSPGVLSGAIYQSPQLSFNNLSSSGTSSGSLTSPISVKLSKLLKVSTSAGSNVNILPTVNSVGNGNDEVNNINSQKICMTNNNIVETSNGNASEDSGNSTDRVGSRERENGSKEGSRMSTKDTIMRVC